MRIIIEDDYEKMSKAAADIIADMIRANLIASLVLQQAALP